MYPEQWWRVLASRGQCPISEAGLTAIAPEKKSSNSFPNSAQYSRHHQEDEVSHSLSVSFVATAGGSVASSWGHHGEGGEGEIQTVPAQPRSLMTKE